MSIHLTSAHAHSPKMVMFCILVFLLPYAICKRHVCILSESPVVATVTYGLKTLFIFVAVLFMDAFQHMLHVTAELELAHTDHTVHDIHRVQHLHTSFGKSLSYLINMVAHSILKCAAEHISHWVLSVPLPCLDAHLFDCALISSKLRKTM